MSIATIIRAWKDGTNAYLAARVDEGGQVGAVEYIGSLPLADLVGQPIAQQKAALVAAVKTVRDAQVAQSQPISDIAGITGTATI